MGNNVDNQAARDAARQAQRSSQPQQSRSRAKQMGVASQGTTSAFGNILQQSMQEARPTPMQEPQVSEGEEKPESQREEAPREGRRSFRDTLLSSRSAEDRVQEHQRQRDTQDDTSKDQRQSSGQKDSTQHAKEAEQRVVARQGQGESGSQGQEGGQKGGRHGTGAEQGRQQSLAQQKGETKEPSGRTRQNMFNQAATAAQPTGTAATLTATGGARGIPQHIIDQVVQAARLIQRPDGKTEMEVQLHDEIFKGLRVRVALNKEGKIQATFVTAHRDVRDRFQQERGAIRSALEEKGLELEGVDVIMI